MKTAQYNLNISYDQVLSEIDQSLPSKNTVNLKFITNLEKPWIRNGLYKIKI